MATYYWVGGAGTWNSTNTANWSLNSGGSGGAGYPTPLDDVIFDSGSGTGIITVTGSSVSQCRDFTATASQFLQLNGTMRMYGNLSFPAGGSFDPGSLVIVFVASGAKTINTNGKTVSSPSFSGAGGSWTLLSAFNYNLTLTFSAGTLNTNGQTVTGSTFLVSGTNPKTLNLGASTIAVATWNMSSTTGLTFNAGTSTISSAFTTTFTGAGLTYNNLNITATQFGVAHTITGANTFNNLSIAAPAVAQVTPVTLGANQTVTGTVTAIGAAADRRIFFRSDIVGTPRTITAAAWSASPADLDFRDIVIAGAVGTLSGTRFGDCGGNSGITFPAPKTVYWNLTGSQNWSATGWAPGSGGTPAASNFPLAQDTAVIDNAGALTTLTINASYNIGTLDASARTSAGTLASGTTAPSFYGNVTLGTGLTMSGTGNWTFARQSLQTINTNGVTLTAPIVVDGGTGTLRLLSNVTISSNLEVRLTSGTLDLNNLVLTLSSAGGVFAITANNLARSIAFGTTGSINIATTSGLVWSSDTITNFTLTGTPTVNLTGASTSGTRSINHGTTAGGTEANAINLNVSAGSGTTAVSFGGNFRNVNFTGYAGTINTSTRTIYGNLLISTGATINGGTLVTTFAGTNATQDLTSNGKTLDFPIIIGGTGTNTTLRLLDALTQGSIRTFTINAGCTFNANTFSASVGNLTFSTTPTITNPAGSVLTCSSVTHNGGTLTMSAGFRLTVTGTYSFTAGTLDFGNQSVSFGSFNASGSGVANTRTMNLGSGTITITGSGITAWSNSSSGGLNLIAGTSTISMTSASAKTFSGGSRTYYNLQQAGAGTLNIENDNTFNTISNTVQPVTINFTSSSITTVASLNLNGTAGNLVTLAPTSTTNYTVAYRGGTVNTMNFVSVSRFTGSTTGIFFATNSTDGGNNTNLTFGAADTTPRYWVGGTASWTNTATANWATASGGTGGASAPTIETDVFFDSGSNVGTGSFTVTATGTTTAALVCRNLTIGGLDGTMNLAGTGTINIYGSWAYPAANFGRSYGGAVNFRSTATGRTITSNGQTLTTGSILFDGIGGGWTLADALNITSGALTVTNGSFSTANFALTIGAFNTSNTNVRSISFGSSTVTAVAGAANWSWTATNLTFDAGTSTVNFLGNANLNVTGSLTWYNVTRSDTGSTTAIAFEGTNTFNNLTLGAPSLAGAIVYGFRSNMTVNGVLSCSGASPVRRVVLRGTGFVFADPGTQITLTVNSIASLADTDFRDMRIVGAAAPVSGTRLGNAGGNSGITFDVPKTVYWNLAGAQDFTATGWATGSGGTPAINNFPLAQDTAVFDDAGSITTLNLNLTNLCYPNINMSARTSAMTFALGTGTYVFYGSFLFGTGVALSGSSGFYSFTGRGSHNIQSNGKQFLADVVVNCATGTYTLTDAFNTVSTATLSVVTGNFVTANQTMTVGLFASSNVNTRSITLGTSTINLAGTGTVLNFATVSGLTFSGASSTVNLTDTSTTARTVDGGGLTWGTLNIGGTTGTSNTTLSGTNTTWNNITSTKTVAHTITLTSNAIINFNNFNVSGSPGALVTLVGGGSTSFFNYTGSGVVSVDYIAVSGAGTRFSPQLTTSGSAITPFRWYLGNNSVNTLTLGQGTNGVGAAFLSGQRRAFLVESGGGTWTVPTDWDSNNNTIYLIGAGGAGGSAAVSGNNRAAGGGGGGGGFTAVSNVPLTPGSTVSITVASVTGSGKGEDTIFNGTYWAGGGQPGSATTTPSSAGGAGGVGLTANGGAGGVGSFGTTASAGYGSGGGGGAGGPGGVGGAGGAGYGGDTVSANITGGGGGGNGGGSAGGNASQGVRGVGGNNALGTGGSGTGDGSRGGGGAGGISTTNPGSGGRGLDILNTTGGAGGTGGAGAQNTGGTFTGAYGGGGTGAIVTTAGTTSGVGAGTSGMAFIVYTPFVPPPIILSGVTITGGITITSV